MNVDASSAGNAALAAKIPPLNNPDDRPCGKSPSSDQDRHLRTDHLSVNLKGRTISSGIITLSSQGIKFALQIGSTMVLARLLSPGDFGLIAMVGTVMAFLRVFKDAGLSAATVQREGITHAQVSNLFWVNLGVSAVLGALVACLAPVIAWFYKEPKLVGLTLALSITFILGGSTVQHAALLSRQMRFKAIALIEVSSMVVGILVGVIMALTGFNYWSLVGLSVSQELTGIALTWFLSRWRPQLPVRRCGTRSLLNFGANLTVANLVWCVALSMDSLLIGKFFGADAVGLYSRSMALLMQPVRQLLSPITAVFAPTLARLQSDPDRYRRTFLQVYNAISLVSFMGSGLLLALAKPVVLVLLGDSWGMASSIFAGFTSAALFAPLSCAANWLFISQGRGQESVLVSVVCGGIAVTGICIGLPYGPAGVATVWSLTGLLIGLPYYFYIAGRKGPVQTKDLWLGFVGHLPVWCAVFGSAFTVICLTIGFKPLVQLLVGVPIGLTAGVAMIYLWKPSRLTAADTLRALAGFQRRRMGKAA